MGKRTPPALGGWLCVAGTGHQEASPFTAEPGTLEEELGAGLRAGDQLNMFKNLGFLSSPL